MAKGWKQDSERRERLLGSLSHGHGDRAADSDLCEEDVWPMAELDDASEEEDAWPAADRRHAIRASRRWHAMDDRHVGGLSLAFHDGGYRTSSTVLHQYRNVDSPAPPSRARRHHSNTAAAAASAPVNVPCVPRISWVDSADSLQGSAGMDDEWMPPHEYLAREHGKTVATSVLEGVGRTLKGRDMRRVRDAVWSQTGFFG